MGNATRGTRVARVAAYTLLGVVVLLLLALMGVRAYLTPDRTQEIAQREVSGAISGELEIGELEWSPFPVRAVLEDITLRDLDDRVVLEVSRATVTLDLPSLLRRTVRVERLEVEGLVVRLVPAEPAGYTISQALETPERLVEDDRPGWDVIIEEARIHDGRVELETGVGLLLVEGITIEQFELRWVDGELTTNIGALIEQATLETDRHDVLARGVSVEGLRLAVLADEEDARASIDRLQVESLEALDIEASIPRASGSFSRGVARIEELVVDLSPGLAEIEGEIDLFEEEPRLRAAMSLVDVRPGRLAGAWMDPDLLPERVDGEVRALATLADDPRGSIFATLRLTGLPPAILEAAPEALRGELPDSADLSAEARLVEQGVSFEELRLAADGLFANVAGLVRLDEGANFELVIDVEHGRPSPLLAAAGLPFVAADVAFEGALRGSLPLPTVTGELRAAGIENGAIEAASLVAPLRLEDGALHIDGARLEETLGSITAAGTVSLFDEEGALLDERRLQGHVSLRRLDLAVLDERFLEKTRELRGLVDGDARVNGTILAPRVVGRLSGDDLKVMGAKIEEATASVDATTDKVHLTSSRLLLPGGGEMRGLGRLDIEEQTVELSLSAAGVPAAFVFDMLEVTPRAEGTIDGSATVFGPLRRPRLTAEARLDELRVDGLSVGEVRGRASGDLERLELAASVEGEAGVIEGSGRLRPMDGEIEEAVARGSNLLLSRLPGTEALPLELGGVARFELQATGPISSPRLLGRLDVDELTVGDRLVHTGRLIAMVGPLEDGALAAGVALPGAAFLRLRIEPGPPLVIEATGDIEDLELGPLLPGMAEAGVNAHLVGELVARYQREPSELEASLHLPELRISILDETLSARRPVTIRYEGDTFILENLDLEGPPGRFQAGGAIGEEIDFIAFGRFDAAVLGLLPWIVRANGALIVDLEASGPRSDPTLAGSANIIETVELLPRGMLREVVVESLAADLVNGRLDLHVLAGHVAGGAFFADGVLSLDGLQPVGADLSLRGQSLPFRAGELVGEVNVDLRATGDEGRVLVSGWVDAVRGRYVRQLAVSGFSLVADEPLAPPAEPPAMLEEIELDVRVTSAAAVDVRAEAGSFGLDLVLDADLWVTGTAMTPRVEGRVEAARGVIRTPQADLPIMRGYADFVPTPAEPIRAVVEVVAEGEVLVPPVGGDLFEPTHFVSLVLEGEADDMNLELVSLPPLDRLEILSLLVTGQVTPTLLAPGDRRHVESAMIFAGTRLAEPLTEMITQRLEDVLNLDLFVTGVTIEGITITAGAEVSRRLRLEGALQQGFGDAGAMALARASLLLTNTLFLEAAAQAVGEGAGSAIQREREGRSSTLELRARILGGD